MSGIRSQVIPNGARNVIEMINRSFIRPMLRQPYILDIQYPLNSLLPN